ncbi:hypothetical protein FUA48_05205 [Flavobacterium alkalisoli]|uniref:Cysteine-rich CPCC domain-containing protein n=1 Tax=Flavobacterium alkalisoli TaxID=2602769 RepID=A0A5B9FTQ8_9FLAO|nr:CPCC family cysteine-rich protein [Flavobacterium alkalisoli]QEE48998.1 hypothetical protein FUA48_05205 [Flavobacterium alkalisoli]
MDFLQELHFRRDFFHNNFSIRPEVRRLDTRFEIFKISCPVCGYLTLKQRCAYDICWLCFWEDDGTDNFDSEIAKGGPNGNMTLSEARTIFLNSKRQLMDLDFMKDDIRNTIKLKMIFLDNLILNNNSKNDILKAHEELIAVFEGNSITGLDSLFRQ